MAAGPETLEGKRSRIFLAAGEASGDFHGALLAEQIKALSPNTSFLGVGGPKMRQAGFHLLYDSTHWGAMGISQAIPKIPPLLLALHRLVASLRRLPPDLAILIDFGAFNLRLGRKLRQLGIPVLYYFQPASWSRQPVRVNALSQACDVVVSPFPWSAQALSSHGLNAHFFGHPLLDVYGLPTENSPLPTPDSQLQIALLPGSRSHEIKYLLPHLLAAAAHIRQRLPNSRFTLSVAPTINPSRVSSLLSNPRWASLGIATSSDTRTILKTSHLALVTSGSITLEAALCALPMVVVYRGSLAMWLQYKLLLSHLTHIAMPNILAQKSIVPELRQGEASGQRIAHEALNILLTPQVYQKMRQDLIQCVQPLTPPGAIRKTAQLALELASRSRSGNKACLEARKD